jgi:shikimate kinase
MTADTRHVVVVGGMAVGKTTIARALADRLRRPLRDSDVDLALARGREGRAVAQVEGVAALHRWEAQHLLEALASAEPVVVAAAASVVDDDRCLQALAAPFVAWLRARPTTEAQRIESDDHRRRLGDDPAAALAALAARRAPRYAEVADVTVDVDALAPDAVVEAVVSVLSPTLAEDDGPTRRT